VRTSIKIDKRAKALRRAMTEPEIMLWSRLRHRGEDRPIFRRQYAYEQMIFDFYCPTAKLAVEIDGSTHWDDEKRDKDQARDMWLKRRGIEVLRIGAGDVYRDLSGVADRVILSALGRIDELKAQAASAALVTSAMQRASWSEP
jgi:very-short-patch-repair endonuclease